MDITSVTQMIGSLGFPIAVSVALMWYLVNMQKQNNETILKMSEAINNNTIALTKISEKFGKE